MRVELLVEPMACHRCLGPLLLAARMPHPRLANCVYIQPLCPRCHIDDPGAQGLLAFFAVHSAVDEKNARTFNELVRQWLDGVSPPGAVDAETFEREIEAWHRGEFDSDEGDSAPRDE